LSELKNIQFNSENNTIRYGFEYKNDIVKVIDEEFTYSFSEDDSIVKIEAEYNGSTTFGRELALRVLNRFKTIANGYKTLLGEPDDSNENFFKVTTNSGSSGIIGNSYAKWEPNPNRNAFPNYRVSVSFSNMAGMLFTKEICERE
jgi:hypothetical protein